MALKSQTTTIGGMLVSTTQLPALRSMALLTRLGKVFAPAVGRLAPMLGGKQAGLADFMSNDVATLGPVLFDLFAQLDDGVANSLICDILVSTRAVRDGQAVQLDAGMIDLVFGADISALIETVVFVLKVNYADFFAKATSGLRAPVAGSDDAPAGVETVNRSI